MGETGRTESRPLAGRYALGRVLGRGAMGVVREATDERLHRPVAVKFLRRDLAEHPKSRQRFEHEARAAARLSHPNVVLVFDSGEDDGIPYLVMERLPGTTFADEMSGAPLALERVCAVAREILSALTAAHGAGIIHRDIKPGNVLVGEDGHVKVADFGIAKTVDELDQTQTTQLIATPAYLAPERLAGEPASARSDLYSVGVLLYEALSGRRPFEGGSPLAVMRAVERAQPVPLASLQPALPSTLVDAVERAMAGDPHRRFESAAEMAAALDVSPVRELPPALVPTEPVEFTPVPETILVDRETHDGATQTLTLDHHGPVGEPPEHSGRRSRPRRTLAIVVAAIVALIGAGAAIRSRNDNPTASTPTTTSSPGVATATTTKLPAPLDNAIQQLERAVGT